MMVLSGKKVTYYFDVKNAVETRECGKSKSVEVIILYDVIVLIIGLRECR